MTDLMLLVDQVDYVHPVTLRYPTLRVKGSPARWMSHSHLTDMTTDQPDESSTDEASSSLGESSYDFIDDRSADATDDESQSDVAESMISSFLDETIAVSCKVGEESRPFSDKGRLDIQEIHRPKDKCIPYNSFVDAETDDDSPKPRRMYDESFETIKFEEPRDETNETPKFAEVSYPLANQYEKKFLRRESLSSSCNSSLCQVIGPRILEVGGEAYKIAFVGDDGTKDDIIHKLASVLAAFTNINTTRVSTMRPSRFNIVPVSSFGESDNPEVVLINSSVELEVEECRAPSHASLSHSDKVLQLTLPDGSVIRSKREGREFKFLDDWRLPDLAIVSVSDNDDAARLRQYRYAQRFLSRHRVRTLIITATQNIDTSRNYGNVDPMLPHFRFKDKSDDRLSTIYKRMPIDLQSFLKIDAGQLNRNLACLAQKDGPLEQKPPTNASNADQRGTRKAPYEYMEVHDPLVLRVYHNLGKLLNQSQLSWTVFVISSLIIFLVSTVGVIFSTAMRSGVAGNASPDIVSSVIPTQQSDATHVAVNSIPSVRSSDKSAVPGSSLSHQSLSMDTNIASFIDDHAVYTQTRSELFRARILGDQHIVVTPPQWLSRAKNSPQVSFSISRDGDPLSYKSLQVFEDFFALQVAKEEAYGVLNVKVWTTSKPAVNESFELDFGPSWLKLASLKRATRCLARSVQDDALRLQASFSKAFNKNVPSSLISFWDQHSGLLQQVISSESLQSCFKRTIKSKRAVASQLQRSLNQIFSRLYADSPAPSRWIIASTENFQQQSANVLKRYLVDMPSGRGQDWRTYLGQINSGRYRISIRESQSTYLRGAQKVLLKAWWKVKGLPMKEGSRLRHIDKRCRHRHTHAG